MHFPQLASRFILECSPSAFGHVVWVGCCHWWSWCLLTITDYFCHSQTWSPCCNSMTCLLFFLLMLISCVSSSFLVSINLDSIYFSIFTFDFLGSSSGLSIWKLSGRLVEMVPAAVCWVSSNLLILLWCLCYDLPQRISLWHTASTGMGTVALCVVSVLVCFMWLWLVPWPIAAWGGKGLFQLAFPSNIPSLRKVRAGTEVGTVEEGCSLAHALLTFLHSGGPPA